MRLAVMLVFVTVVCALVYAIFTHPGVDRLEVLQAELDELQTQNRQLAERNDELERQILALRDDPRLAERRARESVGLARPGELIFQFEEDDEEVTMHVWLEVDDDELRLAGQPVELADLGEELEGLDTRLPTAALNVEVDDEVGPVERQRVVDIVEASPLGPGQWVDDE